MLRVQETNPPKPADKKQPTREFSRPEKKNPGFFDELVKVAKEMIATKSKG